MPLPRELTKAEVGLCKKIMTMLEALPVEYSPQGSQYWQNVYEQLVILRDFKLQIAPDAEDTFVPPATVATWTTPMPPGAVAWANIGLQHFHNYGAGQNAQPAMPGLYNQADWTVD